MRVVVVTGGRDLGASVNGLPWHATPDEIDVALARDRADRKFLFDVLDEIHDERPIALIRNGGMTGADALSSRWAYSRKVDTECVGALWGQHGAKAGPIRNGVMLDRPTTLVVAFPGGRGTAGTVDAARRRGIPVIDRREGRQS